jgi:hypothetical protein
MILNRRARRRYHRRTNGIAATYIYRRRHRTYSHVWLFYPTFLERKMRPNAHTVGRSVAEYIFNVFRVISFRFCP